MTKYQAAVCARLQARFDKLVDYLQEQHAIDCADNCFRMADGAGGTKGGKHSHIGQEMELMRSEPGDRGPRSMILWALNRMSTEFSGAGLEIDIEEYRGKRKILPKGRTREDFVKACNEQVESLRDTPPKDRISPETVDRVFDWIRSGGPELVARTAWTMIRMVDGETPGKGYLIPDDPPGFLLAVLRHAADSFPWSTSTDVGRLLHAMILSVDNAPETEIPLGKFPDTIPLSAVADWINGFMFFGAPYDTAGIKKAGWFPMFEHPATAPGKLAPLPGLLPPSAFAVLYLADKAVRRWHAPKDDPHGGHREAARVELDGDKKYKGDNYARQILTTAVYEHETRTRAIIGYPENLQDRTPDKTREMLFADSALADYLEPLGDKGREAAEFIRQKSRGQWIAQATGDDLYWLWIDKDDKPPRYIRALARVLWADVVRLGLEREPISTPALTRTVFDSTANILRRNQRLKETENGIVILHGPKIIGGLDTERLDQLECETHTRKQLIRIAPAMERNALVGILEKKMKALSTLAARRLVHWMVNQGWQQVVNGDSDPRCIDVPGGLDGLRRLLKCSKKASTTLRDTLDAMKIISLPVYGGGHVSLLMWDEIKGAGPGQRAQLRIVLNDPLLPGFVHTIAGTGRSKQEASRLVPVVSHTLIPPGIGGPRNRAPQATLQAVMIREMADKSPELVTEGSVSISENRWKQLADESELPKRLTFDVVENWQRCDNWLFPVIEQVKPGRYVLGRHYKREMRFLQESGKLRIGATEGGKRSARKKRQNPSRGKRKKKTRT